MPLLIANYSHSDAEVLKDSWKTQFRDLRLKDFSDAFGMLKFQSILPSPLQVEDPYIFKLTKDNASFMLIGTFHLLPLSIYPQNLIDLMLSNKIIVVEYSGPAPAAIEEQINFSKEEKGVPDSHLEEQDWLEEFSTYDQQFLSYIFHDLWPEYSQLSFTEFDRGFANKLPNLIWKGWSILSSNKIDFQLLCASNFIKHYHLDTPEEHYPANISDDSWGEECGVENETTVREFLHNQLDYAMMMDIMLEHISGGKGRVPYSVKSSVQARNLNWVENFKHIEHLPEILVAVGCNHLFYENGLLPLWSAEGWAIERVNLAGDWQPIELTTDGLVA